MQLLLRHRALGLATAVFLVTTAVAAGLAFAGSALDDRRYAVPLLALLIGTGVVALLGWAGERARREEEKAEFDERTTEHVVRQGQALAETERLGAELSAALAQYDTDKLTHDELESELRARVEGLERAIPETQRDYEARLDRQAGELSEAHRLRADTAEARRIAREWTANLRSQIAEFERERGPLADPRALRPLLLRASMTLVAARRGLLTARTDEAGLSIVCEEGFGAGAEAAAQTAPAALDRGLPTRQPGEGSELLTVPFRPAGGPEGALVFADPDPGRPELPNDALMALAETVGVALHDLRVRQELRDAFLATIGVLTDAVEAKDRFMLGHGEEVASYVTAVADRLGLEPRRREELVYAALLHDLGKIAISESILLKPSELSAEERGVIQLHPRIGAELVRQVAALRGDRRRGRAPSRALGRNRVSGRAGRRRDPGRGPRARGRGRVQRHDRRPALPRRASLRRGVRGARALRRDAVRPDVRAALRRGGAAPPAERRPSGCAVPHARRARPRRPPQDQPPAAARALALRGLSRSRSFRHRAGTAP